MTPACPEPSALRPRLRSARAGAARARRCFGPALAAVVVASCTVGPNYQRPATPTPKAYEEAQNAPATAITDQPADLSAWWRQFADPELDSLIARALAGNLNVATALSRIREARAQERQTAAAELPTLSAAGNALTFNSNRKSAGGPQGGGSAAGALSLPGHTNLYSVGFDATWEVDLFGGVRRRIEQARADTEVQQWALRDLQVSLTAEVANAYLALRLAQARTAIGEAELARQQNLFTLIGARRQTGFVTNLDVNQQSQAVASAAAQLPQLRTQARAQIHALGVLLGQPPEALTAELSQGGALPASPTDVPVGLPSDLLRRRPDVHEAERRLAAATAGIGVQVANLYPQLNLYGLGSFASNQVGNLFSWPNLSSAALGMLTQPIFDAGKRRAAVRAAREEREQALLAYRGAILAALRDVEDALVQFRNEEARRQSLERAVSAASGSLTIAQDQYRTGFVPFINVLQSEVALLNARDQLAQSNAQVALDLAAIYKALGGGWSVGAGGETRDEALRRADAGAKPTTGADLPGREGRRPS